MARPFQEGLEYFPMDVGFYEDIKIEKLSIEYGPFGESVYQRLLCWIYRDKGYYLKCDMDTLTTKLVKSIGAKWARSTNAVEQVILYCADIGLFCKDLLLQGVLTSVGIQRRYRKATERRRQVSNRKYWPLDENGEPYENAPMNGVSVYNNPVHVCNNPGLCTQESHKEKESKEKESKAYLSAETEPQTQAAGDPFDIYAGGDRELHSALKRYEEMRIQTGKQLTSADKGILLKRLDGMTTNAAEKVELLDDATLHKWGNVYVNDKKRPAPTYADAEPAQDHDKAYFERQKRWRDGGQQ